MMRNQERILTPQDKNFLLILYYNWCIDLASFHLLFCCISSRSVIGVLMCIGLCCTQYSDYVYTILFHGEMMMSAASMIITCTEYPKDSVSYFECNSML